MLTATASGLVLIDGLHNSSRSAVPREFISHQMRLIFQWIFYCCISEITNVFGTVANIINIVCFIKQGLHDSVNISLLGNVLAISYRCYLFCTLITASESCIKKVIRRIAQSKAIPQINAYFMQDIFIDRGEERVLRSYTESILLFGR